MLLYILLYCVSSFVFQVQGESRLVGGDKVPLGVGGFHASLQNLTGHHVCGGAVVSHRHIVTAAHCLIGANPSYIKAVVGTTDLDIPGFDYDVELIHIHPKYNRTTRIHDIAVVKKNGESSRRMLMLEVPVFNQTTCRYAMRYARKVYDTMFCTFTNIGQGTCHGDSGGPLVRNNKLVGLVSWGIPCAVGFPDVHTRISFYIDWIREIMDKTNPKCNC
ncbi:unnamed protein product [Leptosia nina]|uniref:Peptidase S1 domain-containing protein n=1 Tax=Leptosia nina TaxID=320188 RepID=A0AAV1J408_9NEOP